MGWPLIYFTETVGKYRTRDGGFDRDDRFISESQ